MSRIKCLRKTTILFLYFVLDIEEYAKRIGINISSEPELLYLAREGLRASLPDGWKPW